MSIKVTNVPAVYEPWAATQPSIAKRMAVLNAVMSAAEHYDELLAAPAAFGHPLKRAIEVPEAEVLLRVLLASPNRGIHLLSIDPV